MQDISGRLDNKTLSLNKKTHKSLSMIMKIKTKSIYCVKNLNSIMTYMSLQKKHNILFNNKNNRTYTEY